MTVKELLEELKGVPLDTEVLVSSDSEGNDIGSIHELAWTEDDEGRRALVVWPA